MAQPYPHKPIRLISPYAAGGGSDTLARVIGHRLNESWGQPVVVDNRPGAAGSIGAELVAKAPPDGYTVNEDTKTRMAADGAEVIGSTPEELTAWIRSDLARWAKPVKDSGARVD